MTIFDVNFIGTRYCDNKKKNNNQTLEHRIGKRIFNICYRQTVVEFLDLSLLKDVIYDNIIFGMALTFFADLTFFTLEPLFLDKNNLSKVIFQIFIIHAKRGRQCL